MTVQLLNIGFGNSVAVHQVIGIVSPESAPIKRTIAQAKEQGKLIDATRSFTTVALSLSYSIYNCRADPRNP